MQATSSSIDQSFYEVPTISMLRDRLLQEARDEHQRCLQVAEAAIGRRDAARRGHCHAGTQTEATHVAAPPTSSLGQESMRSCPGIDLGTPVDPSRDDNEQAEAIQALLKMNNRGSTSSISEAQLAELIRLLRREHAERKKVEQLLAKERASKDAAKRQVFCLECELDSKETALQVAEMTIEQRSGELQQAQKQVRALLELIHRGGLPFEDTSTSCGSPPRSEAS